MSALEGKRVIELGAGIGNHSVLIHRYVAFLFVLSLPGLPLLPPGASSATAMRAHVVLCTQDAAGKTRAHGAFRAAAHGNAADYAGERLWDMCRGRGRLSCGRLASRYAAYSHCAAVASTTANHEPGFAAAAEGGPYDSVVANPPFAQSGKYNRRYFIDELILNAHKLLTSADGVSSTSAGAGATRTMVFVQSSAANVPLTMQRLAENGWEAWIVLRRDYP